MIPRKFNKVNKTEEVRAGCVLVAQPFWNDEIYWRSVILLSDHDQTGSSGIVLNKPSTLYMSEALPQLKINPPLYYGGRFDCSNISYMHTDESVPEVVCLGHSLFLGGNFKYTREMILNKKIDLLKIKFFAGFMSWSSGKLESKILENRWWISELNAEEFFRTSAVELWSYELQNNGHIWITG